MTGDMTARMAAVKDIPTERLIELAQAEAAGLVTISTSPADIYSQAVTIAAAPQPPCSVPVPTTSPTSR